MGQSCCTATIDPNGDLPASYPPEASAFSSSEQTISRQHFGAELKVGSHVKVVQDFTAHPGLAGVFKAGAFGEVLSLGSRNSCCICFDEIGAFHVFGSHVEKLQLASEKLTFGSGFAALVAAARRPAPKAEPPAPAFAIGSCMRVVQKFSIFAPGVQGVVQSYDSLGNAWIRFDNFGCFWVFRKEFAKLERREV